MSIQATASRAGISDAPQSTVFDGWYTRCPVPTTFGIALQLGYFKEEFGADSGVEFHALQESKDPLVLQSHYTHTQRNSLRHGGNIPAIYAQATGANTKVIGLSFLRSSQSILTLPDSGIHSVRDLRGRRLLVPRRAHEAIDHAYYASLRVYETALATEGLTLADVEIVEQPIQTRYIDDRPRQRTSADTVDLSPQKKAGRSWQHTLFPLVRREVDVITAGGSGATLFETQAGLEKVFDLSTLPLAAQANNNAPLVFAVKADLLAARPDFVARVLKRVLQAERFVHTDLREARRVLATELSTSEIQLQQQSGDRLFDELELDFSEWKVQALKSQARFLWEKGAIPAPIDVDAWLAPDLLRQVRAEVADGLAH